MRIELIDFNETGWLPCFLDWDDIDTQRGYNFIPNWNVLEEYIGIFKSKRYLLNCLIKDIESKNIVGHITLSDKVKPDIAIWIFKDYRNQGIGRKGLIQALEILRHRKCITEVYAGIYKRNIKSISLFKSLGFVEIGNDDTEIEIYTGQTTYQILYRKEISS